MCRRLHSATRQQRRVSCGTHTNIYVSGELINSNQSLITIQRTHTTKIKTTSTPSWSEGIEVKTNIVLSFHVLIFSFVQLKLKFPTPSPHLFDLKSSSLYISTRASSRPLVELTRTFLIWKTTLMTGGFHQMYPGHH